MSVLRTLSLLVACVITASAYESQTSSPSEKSPKGRPLDDIWSELSEGFRAAVIEEVEDEQLLRLSGLALDGPGLLEYFRKRTPGPDEEKRLADLIERLGDESFDNRQKATADLKALGSPALPHLRKAVDHPEAEVRRRVKECIASIEQGKDAALTIAAVRRLRVLAPEGTIAVLLNYMPFAADATVEETILFALLRYTDRTGKLDAALAAALSDKLPSKREAAALLVGRSGLAEYQPAVRRLLKDDEPKVRLRAAQGLLAARDKEAVPVLIDLLTAATLENAQQAEEALALLAGNQAPKASLGKDDTGRRACREAWEAWWKTNEAKIDMASADVGLLPFGATRRPAEVAYRFFDALLTGNIDAGLRTMDLPFVMGPQERFTTKEQLEKFWTEVTSRTKQMKFTWTQRGQLSGEEAAKMNSGRFMKGLEDVPARHLRFVFVQLNDGNRNEDLYMIVRVTGGKARVIGVGNGPPKMEVARPVDAKKDAPKGKDK